MVRCATMKWRLNVSDNERRIVTVNFVGGPRDGTTEEVRIDEVEGTFAGDGYCVSDAWATRGAEFFTMTYDG